MEFVKIFVCIRAFFAANCPQDTGKMEGRFACEIKISKVEQKYLKSVF